MQACSHCETSQAATIKTLCHSALLPAVLVLLPPLFRHSRWVGRRAAMYRSVRQDIHARLWLREEENYAFPQLQQRLVHPPVAHYNKAGRVVDTAGATPFIAAANRPVLNAAVLALFQSPFRRPGSKNALAPAGGSVRVAITFMLIGVIVIAPAARKHRPPDDEDQHGQCDEGFEDQQPHIKWPPRCGNGPGLLIRAARARHVPASAPRFHRHGVRQGHRTA